VTRHSIALALVVATLAWGSPARAAGGAAPPKVAARVQLSPQVRSQLSAEQRRQVQLALSQARMETTQRLQVLQASIRVKKNGAAQAAKTAAVCAKGVVILEVTPTTFMPGDPLVVTGCGFNDSTGMLLLSDGNQQLKITSWSDTAIEATIPALGGFADPKSVTLSVVTVAAGKSAPSAALTLKPRLVLKEIVPAGVSLGGCGDFFMYGIVQHQVQPGDAPNCAKGTDTVSFGIQLKNNWTFHSLVFSTLCTAANTPCGGPNGATPAPGTYQLGKSFLPDLVVSWQGFVAYYPAIMVMGPEGTPAQ
jgi:hypothetical protein